ncbi:MAG TPA: cory-CC-star protein [Vicinamibacterales bacterium]|nr:cory-CC-star protein [Vicinamibacterales bacterium]
MSLSDLRRALADVLAGAFFGRIQHELRKDALALDDLFMLLCYLELMGVPNPATFYLLDLYPLLLGEFHQWHRRMGIAHSPLDSLPCC